MTINRFFRGLLAKGSGALLGVAFVACGSSSSSSTSWSSGPDAATGGRASSSARNIEFSPSDAVLLRPGETVTHRITVTPPGTYDVGLALLGNSTDAALDRSVVRTTPEGIGVFAITASSLPASFDVRGAIDSLTAILPISVSDQGYATVEVTGTYAGIRKATNWVASLRTDGPCTKFGSTFPGDGSLVTTLVGAAPKLQLTDVPVGLTQSVVLRGEHLIWGCTDLPTLSADKTVEAQVQLYNTGISYGADPIRVTFVLDSNASAWANQLASLGEPLVNAFVQSVSEDPALLLNTMQSSLGSAEAQSEFGERRANGNWDSIVVSRWADNTGGVQCIRDALDRWFAIGATSVTSGTTLDSRVSLSSTSVSLNQVQLTLESMQGLAASAWTSSPQVPLAGTVDANDALTATTYFSFNDELFLRLLAQVAATTEYPEAVDVPAALASVAGCDALSAQLDSATPGSASCGTSCLAQLCKTSLRNLWTNTETAARNRASSVMTLSFACTLRLDNTALAIGCDGTWRGKIDAPEASAITIGGAIN